MKGVRRPFGYTIIEVLIVLAISGVMFVIGASFVQGREARTAFTEGTNEFASKLQAVIAEVNDGQYSDVGLRCQVLPTRLDIQSAPASLQGTNSQCTFIGKFIHFFGGAGNTTKYEVFSLAGARGATQLSGIAPPKGAVPTPIAPPYSTLDLTQEGTIPQSLNVKYVKVGTNNYYGIGFAQSLGTLATPTGVNYNTGAQTVGMVYVNNLTNPATTEPNAVQRITDNLTSTTSAMICLTDGTRDAQLILGNSSTNGNQLSVTVQVATC